MHCLCFGSSPLQLLRLKAMNPGYCCVRGLRCRRRRSSSPSTSLSFVFTSNCSPDLADLPGVIDSSFDLNRVVRLSINLLTEERSRVRSLVRRPSDDEGEAISTRVSDISAIIHCSLCSDTDHTLTLYHLPNLLILSISSYPSIHSSNTPTNVFFPSADPADMVRAKAGGNFFPRSKHISRSST